MVAPVRYKIAQKVRIWRLKRKYTIKDLADKTGINYHTLRRYELGVWGIPVGELQVIADALSVSLSDLLPRQKVLKENRCCDKTQWIYNFIAKTRGRKAIYALTKSIRAEEESAIKAARIRMARNMLKAGFANDIIYRATGLSTYEYDNAEEEICTDSIYYKIGQRIKEWRLIRRNTQKDLADKVGLTPKEIHEYERGYTAVSFDKLYEIAGVLSVNIRALLPKTRKNEDGKEENRLLGFLSKYRKTEDQKSVAILNGLVKSLSESMEIDKEKVKKAEKIKVAKDLVKAGVAIDIILRTTDLTAEELES